MRAPRSTPRKSPRQSKPAAPRRRRRYVWYLFVLLAGPAMALSAFAGYYFVVFSNLIDERLAAQQARVLPRLLARPLSIHRGQSLTAGQFVDRLNDLGYANRARAANPGEFAVGQVAVALIPRGGNAQGQVVRVVFGSEAAPLAVATSGGAESFTSTSVRILAIERPGSTHLDSLTLDAPVITEIVSEARERRRPVRLNQVPKRMVQAVLAIEDRRFYDHPGVDVIRSVGALVTNIRGDRPYLVGGSTLTQQLVKNFFLTPEKTLRRKLLEQWLALIIERRLTKDQLLSLYLNEVYLGHEGSFAIHGVGEASRLFFGKDITNVTLGEAATIAGVIQSPQVHSPLRSIERARARRNVVLSSMVSAGFIAPDLATRVSREPILVARRAVEAEAPYFVDEIRQLMQAEHPGMLAAGADVYTTLDLHLQRVAQESLNEGLTQVEKRARGRRRSQPAQGAIIVMNPRTGDVLAMVGGRSYNASQFNRATHARRQPGSVFKPFVYLTAFERAATEGWADMTPATLVADEPTTFAFDQRQYTPTNYDGRYGGAMTLRRALAQSRNIPAVKLAEAAGYDRVAALWRLVGAGTPPRPYPSIALGVFEATPLEMAAAYTVFPNLGEYQPPRWIDRIALPNQEAVTSAESKRRRVAHPQTAFLVTHMLKSVFDEGTGASARAAGFTANAAGKSGTTDDLRDAWFVGFTPDLLTVVWVGFDDNQPLGLSGTQAALPIWTTFMARALAGQTALAFAAPQGITWVEIDRDTGKLATEACPRVFREAFLSDSEPIEFCDHQFY